MSTSSIIAVKTARGYKSIYCHHDGYPRYMLAMLQNHYNTEARVKKLISFGDASVIDKVLEPTTSTHSFYNREKDVCVFYSRDRGDIEMPEPTILKTKEDVLNSGAFIDYYYIFEDNHWTCYYYDGTPFKQEA